MIEELLEKKTGLNVESIGRNRIKADVSRLMAGKGLEDPDEYLSLLNSSDDELAELIEMVTVPETWFFRSSASFDFLREHTSRQWIPRNPGKKLRVLSVPCATGEEPYSIAIALMQCGLLPGMFMIDAVDICRKTLAGAVKGVYGKNSFRGSPKSFIEEYFRREGSLYRIRDDIGKSVRFLEGNILGPELSRQLSLPYQIVFCRNLLIYFERTAQESAVSILKSFLEDEGMLFIGHAEAGILFNSGFSSIGIPGAFAFRKTTATAGEKKQSPGTGIQPPSYGGLTRKTETSSELHSKRKKSAAKLLPSVTEEETRKAPEKETVSLLEKAGNCADRGDLERALELCGKYIDENRLDPEAHFLLGIIRSSMKDFNAAEKAFGKAIYLKPDYYEAMIQLAVIKERSGDAKGAGQLRSRAARTMEKVKMNGAGK